MHRRTQWGWVAAVGLAAGIFCGTAGAAPVSVAYTGQVTGYTFGPAPLDSAVPLGTSVAWSFGFDDAFLAVPSNQNVFGAASQATSGTLQVGGNVYTLDRMDLASYSFDATNRVVSYTFQLTGTGPAIGGGDFYGLFATFDPTLSLSGAKVGFGYTTSFASGLSVTDYVYADTTGAYSLRTTAVPEPGTLGLMAAALAVLGFVRRRGGAAAGRAAPAPAAY